MLGCCQPARAGCGEVVGQSSAPGDDGNRKGFLVGRSVVATTATATANACAAPARGELTRTHENFFFLFCSFSRLRRGRVAADGVEVNTEVHQTRRRAGANGGEMTAGRELQRLAPHARECAPSHTAAPRVTHAALFCRAKLLDENAWRHWRASPFCWYLPSELGSWVIKYPPIGKSNSDPSFDFHWPCRNSVGWFWPEARKRTGKMVLVTTC
jgi:hypothetical protein